MKYIFNLIMMFIAYNGFSQSTENRERRNITTFPNGDESITIIENSETNVIQLTRTEDFNKYEMLDLSNHEAVHRSTKKRGMLRMDGTDHKSWSYRNEKTISAPKHEIDDDDSGSS